MLAENDNYYVIKEGTVNGVAVYDHIALDADMAVEEKTIY